MKSNQQEGGWVRARLLAVVALGLALVAGAALLLAQEFRVSPPSINSTNRTAQITFPADTNFYYILFRGDTATNILTAADMTMVLGTNASLIDITGTNPAAFYRVLKVPVSSPLDTDGDGKDDLYELARRPWRNPLSTNDAVLTTVSSSPAFGETGVSPTRETIIYFSTPLTNSALIGANDFKATFGGRTILSRSELSSDRRKVTLFYGEPLPDTTFGGQALPGSARIRVTLNCDQLRDSRGLLVDGDGDGEPGGTTVVEFDTVNLTPLSAGTNTIVCGRVFASELAVRTNGNTNISVNIPLASVIITADGLENRVRATTDANGNFRLTNTPGGAFFVHIDGRTVTNLANGIRYPDLAYYPYVGKEWQSLPGRETNIGEVYLPLISSATLQTVNPTNATVVTFPTNVLAQHPELAGVTLTVPANSLFNDGGTRGGKVGIAPVPPDRLPGALPQNLQFPLVVTVQTDGAANFDRPAPICLPNLTNPATGIKLPPGAKTALWSFNHDIGKWEVVGPMTISPDGTMACTDPGVGIRQPGWHGADPGAPGGGGGPGGPDGPNPPKEKCNPSDQSCKPPGDDSPDPPKCNPVLLYSGEKFEQVTDLRIKGVGLDFVWARTYSSQSTDATAQGNNWDFSYNFCLRQSGTSLQFCNGAGRGDLYLPSASQTNIWTRNGFFEEIRFTNGVYSLVRSDLKSFNFLPFDNSPQAGKIDTIVDRNGNAMRFTYDGLGRLRKITDTLNRDIIIAYDAAGFIESVTDFAGRSIRYAYYGPGERGGNPGDLKSATSPAVLGTPNGNDFPNGKTTSYTYSKGFADQRLNHNLLTITDGRRNDPTDSTYGQGPYLVNVYSSTTDTNNLSFDRVIRQIRGGDIIDLTYVAQIASPANGQAVLKVILNDRAGNVSEHYYDIGNRLVLLRQFTGRAVPTQATSDTTNRPLNPLRSTDPAYFETRYEYNADYLPTRIIHPNGNLTENIYETDLNPAAPTRTRGNLREVHRLPGAYTPVGDQSILVEKYEYDTSFGCAPCGFNFVTKHTDARGNVTLSQYDPNGNLISRIHRLPSITEQWGYNARGQMTNHVHPDNGAGWRRADAYTYYETGPQRGYLKEQITDANNLRLTTTFEYNAVGILTRRIDPRGHDHRYVVNQLDQAVREQSPEVLDGSGIRYGRDYFYDANNNVVRVEVENRVEMESGGGLVSTNPAWTTTYEYEILNFLTRKSEAVAPGRFVVTEFAYDGNRNRSLTRFGEAVAGRQTNNVVLTRYDERDLPFQEIHAPGSPQQSTRQFDYDPNRNRVREWVGLEDAPRLHSHVFDAYNRRVALLDPMGNVTTNQFDPGGNLTNRLVLGELVDVPGSAGNVRLGETRWVFDAMNRSTREDKLFFNATNQAPIGDGLATTLTTYTDLSQVLTVVNDNGHGTTNSYDTANRLRMVTDAKGNTVTYFYDGDSNPVQITEVDRHDLPGLPNEVFTTTLVYDNLNRRISTTDNVGNVNRSGYDSRGNRTIIIDANTNVVRYAYDGLNRLLRTTREMTASGHGAPPVVQLAPILTRQTWDDSSRLTSQIDDNGNATTYVYDGLNRKFATVFADSTGQTNVLDIHGNAVLFTDANGNRVTSQFDLLDRVTNKLVSVGPTVLPTTTFERFRYDGLSRLVSASNDVSLVTRSYNSLGRVLVEVQSLTNTVPAVVASEYDGVGNHTKLSYPGGRIITTAYDELERKKAITDATGGGNNPVATYSYVGRARVERRDNGNGTRAEYTYDGITGVPNPAGDLGVKRITRTRHTRVGDGLVIDDRTYTWDRMGNKTRNYDMRPGGPQWQREYSYDSAYRLTNSVRSMATGAAETIFYNLDGVGNRISVIGGTNAGSHTMDPTLPEPNDRRMNQYTTTPSDMRGTDRNGNLTLINSDLQGQHRFSFDYKDRMVGFGNSTAGVFATYLYDAVGRRISKIVNGPTSSRTRFLLNSWREIEERDGVGSVMSSLVFGNYIDEVLNIQLASGGIYFCSDHLFSVTATTDSLGANVERYEYSDFGAPTFFDSHGVSLPSSLIGNSRLFTGRILETESALYHFRFRYLQPLEGRFTSRDPRSIWFDRRNFGNAFTYAANNPLRFRDPFGFAAGDKYCNPDDAARDAMKDIYDDSVNIDAEQAGRIYQNPDGTYSYTDPKIGDEHSSNPGNIPQGATDAGGYHSHGAESGPNFDDENFSPPDRYWAYKQGNPIYVVTPSGTMKRYDPDPADPSKGTETDLGNINLGIW